jgi:hypothetical protein
MRSCKLGQVISPYFFIFLAICVSVGMNIFLFFLMEVFLVVSYAQNSYDYSEEGKQTLITKLKIQKQTRYLNIILKIRNINYTSNKVR